MANLYDFFHNDNCQFRFHNVEELPDMVPNKRRVQILPRFEQCKRMKFSNTDACEVFHFAVLYIYS